MKHKSAFLQKQYRLSNEHRKKMFNFITHRNENWKHNNEITISYHQNMYNQKVNNDNIGDNVEKLEFSDVAGGLLNSIAFENIIRYVFKKLNLTNNPAPELLEM